MQTISNHHSVSHAIFSILQKSQPSEIPQTALVPVQIVMLLRLFKEKKHALGGGSGGGGGGGASSACFPLLWVLWLLKVKGEVTWCGEYLSLDFLAVSLGPMFQFGIVALVYVQEKVGPF